MKRMMPDDTALQLIQIEVDTARRQHPDWPDDNLLATAIVCEEAGEAIRAAVQYKQEGGDEAAVLREIVQTAATCIRHLTNC